MNQLPKLSPDMLARVRRLTEEYQALRLNPAASRPMVIVNAPGKPARFRARWEDPLIMLEDGAAVVQAHLELGDDRLPVLRVEFGTAVVASLFGIEVQVKDDSLPFAREAPARSLEELLALPEPELTAGLGPKLLAFNRAIRAALPEGYSLQLPDTQGVFNTAHLVRGNDILMDFYDDPERLGQFFARVGSVQRRLIEALVPEVTPAPAGWFYDLGTLWQGTARVSNCSMEMISPAFYREHVRAHDMKLLADLGGGRVHYCGSHTDVLIDFTSLPGVSGVDFSYELHDFRRVLAETPLSGVILASLGSVDGAAARQILENPPARRNLIYTVAGDPAKGMAWRAALLKKYGCR